MEDINQNLFLKLNSFVGINHWIDSFGILCAEYMPILFILVEIYLFFFLKRKILQFLLL